MTDDGREHGAGDESKFVHLHVHSEYSMLDGMAKVDALCRKAAEQGAKAIALTDHGVMFGAMEFYRGARKHGLVPIVGVEAYIAEDRFDRTKRGGHVTLLAQDEEGYRNLIKLVSIGYTEGYYFKPRIDLDAMAKHARGVICLSGCLSGTVQEPLKRGDYAGAKAAAQAYRDIYGDRLYLEMMRHGIDEQNAVEAGMLRLRDELGLPIVATNDSHYIEHGDHTYHDMFLCVQTGATVDQTERFRFEGDQFYVKSAEEMRTTFVDLPEACDATLEIANRISPVIESLEKTKTFHIPAFPLPEAKRIDPDGTPLTPEIYLRRLCLGGLRKRYGLERTQRDPKLKERMEFELGVIEDMGLSSYFLIVWDFIKYARDHDIPVGPGRGSAVGSIVSYCLGITALDPLKHELYFERFLNPGRKDSMPDIDTDFCIEGRDDVIKYVAQKYGADRVAGIATFGEIKARSAVRDAGRVLNIPLPLVDRVAKLIPGGPAHKALSVGQAQDKIPELQALQAQDPQVARLLDTAKRIEGYIRNVGTHAAAVVIADADLTDYLPLAVLGKKGETTTNAQFDMQWIEELGLLKMDFLGLRNLTVMRAAEKAVKKTIPTFDLAAIPDDDAKTYASLARGETMGVFQLESEGMRRIIMDMKPDRFADIVAAVALYRPGPMDWIPQYISNKHGRTEPQYLHPALERILAETYGVACYQEQIMQIARDIAGYTLAEADKLRKVVGKKIAAEMPKEKAKFLAGAVKNGTSEATAEAIFRFVEPFAGYGFNKSHAVAYGWITYQTAWLKTNHPVDYFSALLSSVTDKTDKLVDYIAETRLRGIAVLPPDVNVSTNCFTAVGKEIRFGFSAIKGITDAGVEGIVAEREANGPFTSLFDLVDRTRAAGVQKKTVESLIKVGAFDALPGHREQHLATVGTAFDRADRRIREEAMGQLSFFGAQNAGGTIEPAMAAIPPATKSSILKWEKEGLGIYVSGHPIDGVDHLLKQKRAGTIKHAQNTTEGATLVVGGMVASVRRIMTKAGRMMLVGKIEDRTGSIEIVLFPNQYEGHNHALVEGAIVAVSGQIRSREVPNSDAKDDADGEGDGETENAPAVERNLIVNAVEEIAPTGWEPLPLAETA